MRISKRVVTTGITTVAVFAGFLSQRRDKNSDTEKQELTTMATATTSVAKTKPKYRRWWGYENPFNTRCDPSPWTAIKWKTFYTNETNLPKSDEELEEKLPIHTPTFENPNSDPVRVTWLGHATTLVQLDGVTILTDPVFSKRCGPLSASAFSYPRFRPAPCTVDDLPPVHVVIISHSHYDHLDAKSVQDLHKKFGDSVHWFVPEGLKCWFTSCGCQNVEESNWWDEKDLPGHPGVKMVFTPAQHWSGRTLVTDKNKSLWGSWCVIGPKHRFFFAGDTGYNDEAFKQIGHHYGPFDLAALPIGAYLPREIMAPQHVDPKQAVMIHKDIKAKKSVGIHWGTFALAYEYYMQPPEDLKKALKEKDLSEDDFFVLNHGESWPKETDKEAAAKL